MLLSPFHRIFSGEDKSEISNYPEGGGENENLCFLIDPSEITFCEFGMLILFYNLSNLLKKKAQKTAVMS